jgi:hypothetical protein
MLWHWRILPRSGRYNGARRYIRTGIACIVVPEGLYQGDTTCPMAPHRGGNQATDRGVITPRQSRAFLQIDERGNRGSGRMYRLIMAAMVMAATVTAAKAADLVLYGVGSLREAMTRIATSFGHAHGLTVATQFAPSGRMRERIENGEHVDVFTFADVGHARKLVEDGRASVMAVFTRNTVCLLSPASFGATTETMLDKMLAPGVHIGVSPDSYGGNKQSGIGREFLSKACSTASPSART